MTTRFIGFAALSTLLLFPAAAQAQQPWIDAGQQAMIQHYNNLIEQQSTPGQEDAVEDARRARGARGAVDAAQDERCDREAVKEKLRPEYERRVRSEGEEAAVAWLREKASEAGRYAAQNC